MALGRIWGSGIRTQLHPWVPDVERGVECGGRGGYPQTPPFPGHPSIPLLRDESGTRGSPLMRPP